MYLPHSLGWTYLCFECQKNISSVLKSWSKDEKIKSDTIQKHEEHLGLSTKQCSDYQTWCRIHKVLWKMLTL